MKQFILKKPTRKHSAALLLAVTIATLSVMNESLVTYHITDGYSTKTVHSFLNDADRAINTAGYNLMNYAAVLKVEEVSNVNTVYLKERFDVRIFADKQMRSIGTTEGTVKEILSKNGYMLDQHDLVSPSLNSMVTAETDIHITRVTRDVVQELVEIPFKTIKKESQALGLGKTRVIQSGENGEKLVTSELLIKDGQEESLHMLSEEILTQPKNQIVEYGVRGEIALPGGGTLLYKKALNVIATAYSTEGWSNNITATGTIARVGAIAVDPKVIPLGSRLYITSADGKSWVYGYAVAEDTGGVIKGNKIDLFFNTQKECRKFGIKKAIVYVL